MKKQKIGRIIFSKVLEMPLIKYLAFIEKTTNGSTKPFSTNGFAKKKLFYAKIMIKDATLCFEVSDNRLEKTYPTQNCTPLDSIPLDSKHLTPQEHLTGCTDNKIICSLKWINTRNKFSSHTFKSLLHFQSKYWFSGKKTDLKPRSFKKFLSLYPLQYLDQTRLSRLISNLKVLNPQNQVINLRNLFISEKKHHSYLIKEIVDDKEDAPKDRDIQHPLAKKGVHLSIRTICNCRKLVNIPNYKERSAYYDKDITFSDHILLSKKYFNKIPTESGVYELSISSKIDYLNYRSTVIYIGSSKNLRKRIANYSGNGLKNSRLNKFINNYDVFVRLYLTKNYILGEKKLLENFKNNYGELPKANSLGGNYGERSERNRRSCLKI